MNDEGQTQLDAFVVVLVVRVKLPLHCPQTLAEEQYSQFEMRHKVQVLLKRVLFTAQAKHPELLQLVQLVVQLMQAETFPPVEYEPIPQLSHELVVERKKLGRQVKQLLAVLLIQEVQFVGQALQLVTIPPGEVVPLAQALHVTLLAKK